MPLNTAAGSFDELKRLARERILILDGAMGSLIQTEGLTERDYRGRAFASHPGELAGCNDLLCLTKPELITSIHEAYLEAGADIITTSSLSSNALSLADYGLAERAYEISRAAGALARAAADRYSTPERRRFAAGSVGPTSKSASISPDMQDSARRSVAWDELERAYLEAIRGLLDGGVDIILLETFFDTLNAKAAAAAVMRLREERGEEIPLIISATLSGPSGRLLAGQTVEAFAVSVAHAGPWALGLNCSLGAEEILPHLETLAAFTPFLVSCHPNAGLPDRLGNYTEGPEESAAFIKPFLDRGLVNIIGGCCGTTPAHIARIAALAADYAPRIPSGDRRIPSGGRKRFLAGLEPLSLDSEELITIGERTNVAGSKKFLRLIREASWEEALDIAREMIAAGARIIDVCMDDALLDGKEAMVRFLNLALQDPEIARLPVMPDSSRWEILEAALKCVQGKALVNSISLKEGEGEFLRRARLLRRYGAAAVVMLFDEKGQAQSFERKTEIAGRSFALLTASGFPAEDIVFDPNVLTIATGLAEHDRYALDFIEACRWIREHCPGAGISGGISNLSFSFRGNDEIRAALHGAFLRHAVPGGLSLAILNPAGIVPWENIAPPLRDAAEDAILCRGEGNYADRLLAMAGQSGGEGGANGTGSTSGSSGGGAPGSSGGAGIPPWRDLSVEGRIRHGLVNGVDKYIAADVLELYRGGRSPLDIIEGPLMKGIEAVGDLFGEGKLFLPQVIRGARVMKKAVAVLEPFMEDGAGEGGHRRPAKKRIILATVKGDVHDIGKNIVGLVLGCNGYEVIDLGVMVPAERILAAAAETGADCVGLSALISPSLDEMVRVAEAMEKAGCSIPLLVGGAAASAAHTALRIAPAYSGPVVYVEDAGRTPPALRSLLSPRQRPAFLEQLRAGYEEARRLHEGIATRRRFWTLEEARARRFSAAWPDRPDPRPGTGIIQYGAWKPDAIIPRIDWDSFCRTWELSAAGPEHSPKKTPSGAGQKLIADSGELLDRLAPFLSLRAVTGFFPALSENEDVILYQLPGGERARFCFLRNQEKKDGPAAAPNYCLADFILPREAALKNQGRTGKGEPGGIPPESCDRLGLFALTAEFRHEGLAAHTGGDDYQTLLAATLANALAEALSQALHETAWNGGGIRPAFGYPACPDHRDKETAFALLEAPERIGLCLSDSAMIIPPSSICGMYFFHPQARYFGTGEIAPDQLADWARRKGISPEEARRRTGRI